MKHLFDVMTVMKMIHFNYKKHKQNRGKEQDLFYIILINDIWMACHVMSLWGLALFIKSTQSSSREFDSIGSAGSTTKPSSPIEDDCDDKNKSTSNELRMATDRGILVQSYIRSREVTWAIKLIQWSYAEEPKLTQGMKDLICLLILLLQLQLI